MYNSRFMTSALEQKEFTVLTQNISFKQYEEFSTGGSTNKIRIVRLVSRKHLQAPCKSKILVKATAFMVAATLKQGHVVPGGFRDRRSWHHGGNTATFFDL